METKKNEISKYVRKALKSEMAQLNGKLIKDSSLALEGHCLYLPSFFCSEEDLTLTTKLAEELEQHACAGMIQWSKHLKHESPQFSETFNEIIALMSRYFEVDVFASRLNFYADGTAWKPFHHDSHAYGSSGEKEDFTMGASFGASRKLAFLHVDSKKQFDFPQNNGDVFAFTSEANRLFQHGVPKSNVQHGPRFSIIAWGRRRYLTERNGGKPGERKFNGPIRKAVIETKRVSDESPAENVHEVVELENSVVDMVKTLGNTTISNVQTQRRRKGRVVQHGWAV